ESLPEGADRITLAYSRIYDNVNQTVWFQVEEGGEIGDMYGTGYLKNEEGKFVIDANGNFVADNRLRKLGNYNPDFILGFNNTFRYKEWDASFLIDWRQGGELVSRTFSLAMVGGQLRDTENRPEEGIVADGVVNVGTDANPIWEQNSTAISAERYYRQYYDRNHEENNIYSATYVKLRQFSVGYTFRGTNEGGILKRGRNVRLALIGRNLFALSEIPHFDPEQLAVQGTRFVGGVEDMSYPSSRSFGIKLDYNF
ncbi:MAG: SusC/RagA family TonB-linked outer membrane protein, partial [Candidatus Andersenbacteria bacterium]|nr:SusC/RagA family TonB-linked outer membrane protein [Candidatus Andersenbacteria bacterium]